MSAEDACILLGFSALLLGLFWFERRARRDLEREELQKMLDASFRRAKKLDGSSEPRRR